MKVQYDLQKPEELRSSFRYSKNGSQLPDSHYNPYVYNTGGRNTSIDNKVVVNINIKRDSMQGRVS